MSAKDPFSYLPSRPLLQGLTEPTITGAVKIRYSLISSSPHLPVPQVGRYVGHVNNLALRVRHM